METTLNAQHAKSHSKTSTAVKPLSPFWKMVEFNRYGIIAMLVILIAGMGGIAAGFGGHYDAFRLSLISLPAAIALSLVLAVAPMKAIVYSSTVAVVIDCFLLIF